MPYVRNAVEYSLDGNTWTAAWESTGGEPLLDDRWTHVILNLGPQADGQSTVYVRWIYEIRDRAYQYSGWNIDDIEIWAESLTQPSVPSGPNTGVDSGSQQNSNTLSDPNSVWNKAVYWDIDYPSTGQVIKSRKLFLKN